MGLSKISIWRGEMDMQKSIKSLKRNGILLLAYDLLVLCIVFVKNGMINMSAEAATFSNCIYWFWNIHQFTLDRGFQNLDY